MWGSWLIFFRCQWENVSNQQSSLWGSWLINILQISMEKYQQSSLWGSWLIFCISQRENITNLACEARGLYSVYFDRNTLRSQLVRLMAYILYISMRKCEQSSLWGSWLIFFISQWENINNLAYEAHGLYSLYLNKKISAI